MQGQSRRGVTEYWSPDERVCERCGTRVRESDLKCRECGVPFVDITRGESVLHQLLVGLLVAWTVVMPALFVIWAILDTTGLTMLLAGALNYAAFIPWATGVLMLGVLCYVTDRRRQG